MSGLLQRLAQRAVGGSAGLSVRPSLTPRFAATRDGGASFGVETLNVDAPKPVANPDVRGASVVGATPVDALQPPAEAQPHWEAAHGRPSPTDVTSPSPSQMRAAETRSTTPDGVERAVVVETHREVASATAAVQTISQRADAAPSSTERRLGWPTRMDAAINAAQSTVGQSAPVVEGTIDQSASRAAASRTAADSLITPFAAPIDAEADRARSSESEGEQPTSPRASVQSVATVRSAQQREMSPLAPANPSRARFEERSLRPQTDESTPPTIHVTIGRIDVRAVPPSPATVPAAPRTPRLTLDQFLAQRSGRR